MGKVVAYTENAADLAAAFPMAVPLESKQYPDAELYTRVPDGIDAMGRDVLLIHRCYPNPNGELLKAFFSIRALRDEGAASVSAFIPYLPYARMDKSVKKGEAVTADYVCRMLAEAGCGELITFDCHFLKDGAGVRSRAGLRIRNLSAAGELLNHFKGTVEAPVVASPDEGAAHMSKQAPGGKAMKKLRGDYLEGATAYRTIEKLEVGFNVAGRDVVILDDMITTGSTMIKAVEALKAAGAKSVRCAATHGLLVNGALQKLYDAGAKEVVCSDSVPSPVSRIRVAPMAAAALGKVD